MPLIFPTSVVSFSSEDPNHPVSNLLNRDTFRKWKCKDPGEKEAFVILKFEKAVQFTAIDFGNECAAMIEVFVGRSGGGDTANVKYETLLSSSILMSATDSRALNNPNAVKSYSASLFDREVAAEKWDLVKIVLTQIFNKHTQYGLTFVKFTAAPDPDAPAKIGIFSMRKPLGLLDDDEDESSSPNRIGAMFAKSMAAKGITSSGNDQSSSTSTGAAIREISSAISSAARNSHEDKVKEVLKKPKLDVNLSPVQHSPGSRLASSSDKLPSRNKPLDSPLNKGKSNQTTGSPKSASSPSNNAVGSSSGRAFQKTKGGNQQQQDSRNGHLSSSGSDNKTNKSMSGIGNNLTGGVKSGKPADGNNDRDLQSSSSTSSSARSTNPQKEPDEDEKQRKPFDKLFEGVVFVMSGFENPYRRNLRDRAVEMGAKCKPDWDRSCTHLICAFVNTPKFRQVRSAGNGKIVKKEWIERSYGARCRFPWRRFCLDRNDKGVESEEEIHELESEGETSSEEILEERPSSPSISHGNPTATTTATSESIAADPGSDSDNSDFDPRAKVSAASARDSRDESPGKSKNKRKRVLHLDSSDDEKESATIASPAKKTIFDDDTDIDDDDRTRKDNSSEVNKTEPTTTNSDSDTDFEDPSEADNEDSTAKGFFKDSVFFLSLPTGDLRKQIETIITKENGKIEKEPTEHVEYWITSGKDWTEEYSEALSDNPNICFITSDWILDCEKSSSMTSFDDFMLTPS